VEWQHYFVPRQGKVRFMNHINNNPSDEYAKRYSVLFSDELEKIASSESLLHESNRNSPLPDKYWNKLDQVISVFAPKEKKIQMSLIQNALIILQQDLTNYRKNKSLH